MYANIGRRATAPLPTADETYPAIAIARIRQLAGVIIGNTVNVPTNGLLGTANTGLSGARLHPLNLALLKAVKPRARVPLIAAGGIADALHIAEYRASGAAGHRVGTAMFDDPKNAYQRINHPEKPLTRHPKRLILPIRCAATQPAPR